MLNANQKAHYLTDIACGRSRAWQAQRQPSRRSASGRRLGGRPTAAGTRPLAAAALYTYGVESE
jgi:hypothetical protein